MSLFDCPFKKKKTDYHHGNLKEALIETALEMVGEMGVEAITLRELNKRVGTSRSALYRHFESKEMLMMHVILAGFDHLNSVIHLHYRSDAPLLERFHAMGKAYLGFATSNPDLYRLLFGPAMMREREAVCESERPDVHGLLHGERGVEEVICEEPDSFHMLVSIIDEAQKAGVFKPGDPVLQAKVIWSMLHGMASLIIDGHDYVEEHVDALYELSFQTLLGGLGVMPNAEA